MPLGNVYYYFKTKDAIIDAVVEAHVCQAEATIASVARQPTPKRRLKALIRQMAGQQDLIARFGCPQGTLCSELAKHGNDHAANRMMSIPIAWVEEQFKEMGRRDAHALAIELMVRYEGTAVLTQALRDPSLMADEGKRLERWIDTLDAASSPKSPAPPK